MRLVLFFTADVSLKDWDRTGLLERETALYRRLQARGARISFVTYGTSEDAAYAARVPGIRILCNRWRLPGEVYRRLLPLLHAPALLRADLYKTNQINGAMAAVRASRLWRKPLVVRCGYLWSDFKEREAGATSAGLAFVRGLEERAFLHASGIVVTTQQMKDSIAARLPAAVQKISVIPNYVLTDCFKPVEQIKTFDLVSVGRLSRQKNTPALLEAARSLGCRLRLIGSKDPGWRPPAAWDGLGARLRWDPEVPNARLPNEICQAKIFILPSLYEGHPKALIEAMACGLPVIGADVPGIREVIDPGRTGLLCATDPESIAGCVRRLLGDPALQQELGSRARDFALQNFSLDRIVEEESRLLGSCLSQPAEVRP